MQDIYSPRQAFAITPNDAVEFTTPTTAIYVGTGGDLTVLLVDDSSAVLLKSVPTGTMLKIRAKRVMAAGTGASNIVGFY
jgi:hypothetical protein